MKSHSRAYDTFTLVGKPRILHEKMLGLIQGIKTNSNRTYWCWQKEEALKEGNLAMKSNFRLYFYLQMMPLNGRASLM